MNRPYRVVVAKPGLDGHGAKVIVRSLRDAAFEGICTGLHQAAERLRTMGVAAAGTPGVTMASISTWLEATLDAREAT